jgi:photosystem II stability/assembly factor-like uncharacterized protein
MAFRRLVTALQALLALGSLPGVGALCAGDERWLLRYFYDEMRANLQIRDIQFPSPQRGVAVAAQIRGSSRKPVLLLTSDGGANWELRAMKELGGDLFFVSANQGWMVTSKGLWKTEDGGLNWKKLPGGSAPSGLLRVYFLDERRGFAIGTGKCAYSTGDGGLSWRPLDVLKEVKTDSEFTDFFAIGFADGLNGIIIGQRVTPSPAATQRSAGRTGEPPEVPRATVTLETRDGGKTWKSSIASLFGRVTEVALSASGSGMTLAEHYGAFKYPAEVHVFNWKTGATVHTFADPSLAVTDILFAKSGRAYLVGVERMGEASRSVLPGKLRVLRSDDLCNWIAMEVDYRADASRALLAEAGDGHLWISTDTGMLLELADQ